MFCCCLRTLGALLYPPSVVLALGFPIKLAAIQWLVHQNVQVLMPNPYSHQHDHFLKKYRDTGQWNVLRIGRDVPCVNKAGEQSVVQLGVEDRFDPTNPGVRYFVGRMSFKIEDPVIKSFSTKLWL